MRILGTPLWALVVMACAVAPFVIRAWIDAEERRAKGRTAALLRSLGLREPDVGGRARRTARERMAPGSRFAASTDKTASQSDASSDDETGSA